MNNLKVILKRRTIGKLRRVDSDEESLFGEEKKTFFFVSHAFVMILRKVYNQVRTILTEASSVGARTARTGGPRPRS